MNIQIQDVLMAIGSDGRRDGAAGFASRSGGSRFDCVSLKVALGARALQIELDELVADRRWG